MLPRGRTDPLRAQNEKVQLGTEISRLFEENQELRQRLEANKGTDSKG